jgi:hypothetical protein
LTFTLTAATSNSVKILSYNEPFHDTIQPKSKKNYQVLIDPLDDLLHLTRQMIGKEKHAQDLLIKLQKDAEEDFVSEVITFPKNTTQTIDLDEKVKF